MFIELEVYRRGLTNRSETHKFKCNVNTITMIGFTSIIYGNVEFEITKQSMKHLTNYLTSNKLLHIDDNCIK